MVFTLEFSELNNIPGAQLSIGIHGGPFCDHRIWDYQIDSLASKYKVICFDKRGHGKSDLPIDAFSHLDDFKSLMP